MIKRVNPDTMILQVVEKITGYTISWEFLCPGCYPEKVRDFLEKKPIRTYEEMGFTPDQIEVFKKRYQERKN